MGFFAAWERLEGVAVGGTGLRAPSIRESRPEFDLEAASVGQTRTVSASGARRLLCPVSMRRMAHLGPVAWPPLPIKTQRLVLRESEASDRACLVKLFSSPDVGTYVCGAQPREELERTVPETPGRRAGFFVVELDGTMIGMVTLDRRDSERPGHVRREAGEAELGYMFLPSAWGRGFATEACAAALRWFASALPGEPVVLCSQTANKQSKRVAAKLGYTEVDRFEEYGAEQWFGVWSTTTDTT